MPFKKMGSDLEISKMPPPRKIITSI